MKASEIFISICVSYTIISIAGAIINMLTGSQTNNLNVISMFVFTTIAVLVLYMHRLFENLSPLMMIVIQYLIAMGLVFLYVYIIGLFDPVAEGGYWDIFRSFTIPYIIGAAVYYISVFQEAKKQNAILCEIRESRKAAKNNTIKE